MKSPFELLGWEFRKRASDEKIAAPYVEPNNDDAAFVVGSSYYGHNVHQLSLDQNFQNENDLIQKYRDISLYPEVDAAVTDIVNESINGDNESCPVNIILDDLDQTENVKKKITEEFDTIIKLLNFNNESYDIFRKWYVDGRSYYHIIINENAPSKGIQELRYISPLHIKKIREEYKEVGPGGVEILKGIEEYFLYTKKTMQAQGIGIRISNDSICYTTSGLIDEDKNMVYSYLHKALKPANQVRMMEDAVIIYRLSRAPERRVFYIDVGSLPKNKAEEYIRGIMNKYKNKMVYDAVTGEVKDSKNTMSMMEDFWLPRREGGRGTEITTLEGGQQLGEMTDVEFFKKKLYMSLGVPYSRISPDQPHAFTIGRSSEITRDEIKFSKFIARLRKRFSQLFYRLLKTQLILKKIITEDEWEVFKEGIYFDFISDTFFKELKDAEILKERISTLREMEPYVGTYFSKEYVRKSILQMDDEAIAEMNKQIEEERKTEPDMQQKFNNFMGAETGGDMSPGYTTLPPPSTEMPEGGTPRPNPPKTNG